MAESKVFASNDPSGTLQNDVATSLKDETCCAEESALISDHSLLNEFKLRNHSKKRFKRSVMIFATAVTDVIAIVCAFTIAAYAYLGVSGIGQTYNVILTVIPIYFGVALNNKAFRANILTDLWASVSRGVTALIFATSSMLLILFFFKTSAEFSRVMFGLGTSGATVLIFMTRLSMFRVSKRYLGESAYANLCIYDGVPINKKKLDGSIDASAYDLVADPSDAAAVNRLATIAFGMDRVIVHCQIEKRESWVFMLRSLDVNCEIVVPELGPINPLAIKRRNGETSLLISAGQLRWDQKLVKRSFDFIFSLAAIIFLSPILVITALSIKITSRGPIFFVQSRLGLGNRAFKILKFRSMYVERSDPSGHVSTARRDTRITKVGAFIRRTSVDELPQLINVLLGDMSIVGPRPHALGSRAENRLFWDIDMRYWHRHVVKPGLTGLAQIRGFRGATEREGDLSRRLHSDLEYIVDWTLWKDIRIISQTFRVIFHKNAY